MMDMLNDAINRAAGTLPEGYTISLHIENGAGWVELYSPDEEWIDDLYGETILEQINEALDMALRHSTGIDK